MGEKEICDTVCDEGFEGKMRRIAIAIELLRIYDGEDLLGSWGCDCD